MKLQVTILSGMLDNKIQQLEIMNLSMLAKLKSVKPNIKIQRERRN